MLNMPINEKAEMALIGALINDPVLIDEVLVTKDDFYFRHNQETFECLVKLKHKNENIDLVSISEYFNNDFDISYFNDVTTLGIISTSFKHWEKIILEKSVCRQQIIVAQQIIEKATQSEDATALFNQDFNSYVDGELEPIKDIVIDTIDYINDYVDGKIEDGIKSDIRPLDHFIGGFKPGDIYYLGARPS